MSQTPLSRRELIAAGAPFIVEHWGTPERSRRFPDAFDGQRVLVDPRGDQRHFNAVRLVAEDGHERSLGLTQLPTENRLETRKAFLAAHLDGMDDHAAAALRLVKDHGAAQEGFPQLTRDQIEKSGVSTDAWLYAAAMHADEGAAKHYLKHGGDPLRTAHDGTTAAKVLLEADLGRVLNAHYGPAGVIAEAAKRSNENTFRSLVDAGALEGNPPAMGDIAVHGSVGMVKQALDAGLDPNALDFGDRPALLRCLAEGDTPGMAGKVDLLLRAGADPNGSDRTGNTAVHYAAARGQGDLIETLVSYGADVNLRNRDAQTPLHTAHPSCVLPLLQLAGDPHAKDAAGETPLHAQARQFDGSTLPAVNSLLHFGADANATDRRGNTVLHTAVQVGNTALIAPLVNQGADPFRKNDEGKPAKVGRLTERDQEGAERVWQGQGHQFDLTRRTAGAPAW